MDLSTFQNTGNKNKSANKRQDRMISFFDAVVAVGITMIVMGIELPDKGIEAGKLVGYIGSEITVYLVSFIALAEIWRIHNEIFSRFEEMEDGKIMNIHMALMFFVTIFPFLTRIMNRYKGLWEIRGLYIASYVVINSLMVILVVVVNQRQAEKKSENEELMKKLLPFFLMKDKPETENAELIRNIKLFSGFSGKQDKTDNVYSFIPEDTRKLMEALGIVEDVDPKVKRIRTIHAMLSLGINFISVMLSVIVLMINPFICYLIFSIRFIIDAIVKKIVEVTVEKVSEKKKIGRRFRE